MIPKTRLVGALMFIGILSNIVVLTWSVGFQGTKWLVVWMFLANLYLVAFDFDRVLGLLVSGEKSSAGETQPPG